MTYIDQPWFTILQDATQRMQRSKVAEALGVSAPTISQVLNGSGKYGSGQASTAKLAERVIHVFGRYPCPYLTEQNGQTHVIDADTCRAHAHRPAPAGSPRDMQFWQACNQCQHKAHTAPHAPREVKPRTPRSQPAPGAKESS